MKITIKLVGSLVMILAVVLSFVQVESGAAQGAPAFIRKVRVRGSDETGVQNPGGIAFSSQGNMFHVFEAYSGPVQLRETEVIELNVFTEFASSARIATAVRDPINIVYDDQNNRLLIYQAEPNQLLEVGGSLESGSGAATVIRHNLKGEAIGDAQGMTVDENGDVYILDASRPRIVRLEVGMGASLEDVKVSDIDLGVNGLSSLRGIAYDPTSGHLHVLDVLNQKLYELMNSGEVVAERELWEFGLLDPQGMVFAPSGDQTDDP